MMGRTGAKCFTGEAKVKQETNEINGLWRHPPPTPMSIKQTHETVSPHSRRCIILAVLAYSFAYPALRLRQFCLVEKQGYI
jgi:hypothetical protein